MEKITLSIPVELDDEFFENIICTMLEGGSNYWIKSIAIQHPDGKKPAGVPNSTWAASALNKTGIIKFYAESEGPQILTKDKIITGLNKWINNHPSHLSLIEDKGKISIDAGNIDANDADAILQYALFGELIYG